MKATNQAWRKFEKTKDPTTLNALGFDNSAITRMSEKIVAVAYSWEKQPFATWELTNLGHEFGI